MGAQVFTKHCAACHRLNGQGTKIGPDLDGIGLRGVDRLLEDVLDPSRNVDQAFRGTTLTTVDGRSIVALVLREEGEVLVLADSQGKELRIPAAEIDERSMSRLSPMAANVADLVPEADFFNLLRYLLDQRQAPAEPGTTSGL
jgi:putative heme-binding domain-containing protein